MSDIPYTANVETVMWVDAFLSVEKKNQAEYLEIWYYWYEEHFLKHVWNYMQSQTLYKKKNATPIDFYFFKIIAKPQAVELEK